MSKTKDLLTPGEYDSATILKLETKNVLGIKAISITPDGKPVVLTGKNGACKSSILAAIKAFMGKKFRPDDFIRHGEEKATVEIQTERWAAKLTVTGNTERLEVRAPDGKPVSSPQAILNAWFGDVTFDPLEFKTMDMSKQAEIIKKLTGLDFTDLEAERKELYDERTVNGRQEKALKAQVDGLEQDWPADLPDEAVQMEEVLQELNRLSDEKDAQDSETQKIEAAQHDIKVHKERINEWEAEIDALQRKITTAEAVIDAKEAEVEELNMVELIDFDEQITRVQAQMVSLQQTNKLIMQKKEYLAKKAELDEAIAETARLTAEIEAIDETKQTKIANAHYPIPGLRLEDGVVTYNGTATNQLSDGEGLRVSCAIAMALNPALRTLLIRNGGLLDREGKQVIFDLAQEQGFQVWMEVCAEAEEIDGKLRYPSGFYLELGEVVAVNGEVLV